MFEQAVLPVQDPAIHGQVQQALEQAFALASVEKFLRGVQRAGLRVRDFEGVLRRGLLGSATPAQYAALGDSDRGRIREQYLGLVEKVTPVLRAKFLKVYAYY